MRNTLYHIIILVLCCACDHTANINAILADADSIVQEQSDSALTILKSIGYPQQLKEKQKADYWRIRSTAHYRKRQAMSTDSPILFSLDYYKIKKDTPSIIDSYLLSAEYYKWVDKEDSVNYMLMEGLKYVKAISDTTKISRYLYNLGILARERKEYDKAIAFFEERTVVDNAHNSYYILANFKKDSVEYFREKSIELALKAGDTLSAAHYMRNYASHLYTEKRYEEAIKLIDRTGEISNYYKDFGNNHIIKTQIYLAQHKLDSAQVYLEKAYKEKLKTSFGGRNDLNLIGTENTLALLQAIMDTKQGKIFDFTPILLFNDSIIFADARRNAALKEQIIEKSSYEQQNLKLIIDKKRTQILLIEAISFILIISLLFYLYSSKKRRKLEEVEERTETLQRLFKEALTVKDEKQKNSSLFRKTLLQQLGIIRLIATSPIKKGQELLGQVVDISNESISTTSLLKWNDLYPIIDSVYDNFHTHLVERYGTILNEKEIQLCCLLCADFSTGETSAIMQQSLQTIYQRRSLIRKKIGISEKQDIIAFLSEQFSA